MKIKVTRKDIKKGKKGDVSFCPIALAVARKFNLDAEKVQVDGNGVIIDDMYYMLRRGFNFVDRFDEGLPVKPCTIELTR